MDNLQFALEVENALGFERALLGTLLAYPSYFEKAEDLMPSDFLDPGHQEIFSQMLSLYKMEQLSARAVVENMRARGILNTVDMRGDGEAYIIDLTTYASAPSIDNFVDNIIKAAMRRQILNASALMAADANQYDIDPEDIIDQTEERIMELRRRKNEDGVTAGNLMDMFETQMTARIDGTYVPALFPKVHALQALLALTKNKTSQLSRRARDMEKVLTCAGKLTEKRFLEGVRSLSILRTQKQSTPDGLSQCTQALTQMLFAILAV